MSESVGECRRVSECRKDSKMTRHGVVCGGGGSSMVSTRQANYFNIEHRRADSRDITQAIQDYTTNGVYREINTALCTDDRYLLQKHAKFINLLRQALYGHRERGIVFRGMFLPGYDHELYQVGRRFLWPGFTSASRDLRQADAFGSWSGFGERVLFAIDLSLGRGVTFCRDISSISEFPEEQEILFLCYSGFQVMNREWIRGGLRITLRPFDTKAVESEARGRMVPSSRFR